MARILRIGLIDADSDIRFGRRMLIDAQDDCSVVFEEDNAVDVIEKSPEALIDVLIVGNRVRGLDGISLVKKLIPIYYATNGKVPVIILTGPYRNDELLLASIAAGVTNLVTLESSSDELLEAVRSSVDDEDDLDFKSLIDMKARVKGFEVYVPNILVELGTLDEKEVAVLAQFKLGLTDAEIAKSVNVSEQRVAKAIKSIMVKCFLTTRAQLFLAVTSTDGQNG